MNTSVLCQSISVVAYLTTGSLRCSHHLNNIINNLHLHYSGLTTYPVANSLRLVFHCVTFTDVCNNKQLCLRILTFFSFTRCDFYLF